MMFHCTLNQVYNIKHFEIVAKEDRLFLHCFLQSSFYLKSFALRNIRQNFLETTYNKLKLLKQLFTQKYEYSVFLHQ